MSHINLLKPGTPVRTWPYGTRLNVTCEHVAPSNNRDAHHPRVALFVDHEAKQGYVTIGTRHDIIPQDGLKGVIEFREGGPLGGYWSLVKEGHA